MWIILVLIGLFGCSRSEVSYELVMVEKPKMSGVAADVSTSQPLSLAEEVKACAESGGEACVRLLGRRAEIEMGGISKQAWVEALAMGCVRGPVKEVCDAVLAVVVRHKSEGVDAGAIIGQARDACERGIGMGCVIVANSYAFRGTDLEERIEDAADYFARACGLGVKPSCVGGAEVYLDLVTDSPHGEMVLARAIEMVRGPCEAGDAEACSVFALASVSGKVPEAKRDLVKGRELSKKACEGKWWPGCNLYAELLLMGLGGETDAEGGRALLEPVCARETEDDATEEACRILAFMHAGRMELMPKDPEKARAYARRACELLEKIKPGAECLVGPEVEELLR